MAFPYESDFWFYLFGKIGRSLMLPPSWPSLSFAVCIVIAAIVILLISWVLLPLLTRKSEINQRIQAGTVLASLGGVVFFYLLLDSCCIIFLDNGAVAMGGSRRLYVFSIDLVSPPVRESWHDWYAWQSWHMGRKLGFTNTLKCSRCLWSVVPKGSTVSCIGCKPISPWSVPN